MRREPSIPIVLWVATAALAHILWGGGAEQVVRVVEGRTQLASFASSVSGFVKRSNAPLQISLLTESDETPAPLEPNPDRDSDEVPEE
ncbi:MAG: hypothetical protein RJA70_4722, partial [Pseudomonadota bacterium]